MNITESTLPLLSKLRTIARGKGPNWRKAANLARWHSDAFTMEDRRRRAAWIEQSESVIKADGYING